MPRRKSRTLTEVELEFMQAIWDLGGATPEEILTRLSEQGRKLSDGSVRKILSILLNKGYLSREREGRTFRYAAEVGKGRANRSMLRDLIDRAFGGSTALMMTSLLEEKDLSDSDLKKIKKLISKREKGE